MPAKSPLAMLVIDMQLGLFSSRQPRYQSNSVIANINRLLEDILLAAKGITGADGGTLYRMDDSGSHLRFEIMHTNSLGLALGGTTGKRIDLPDLPLRNAAGEPNLNLVAAYAALKEETVNIGQRIAHEQQPKLLEMLQQAKQNSSSGH